MLGGSDDSLDFGTLTGIDGPGLGSGTVGKATREEPVRHEDVPMVNVALGQVTVKGDLAKEIVHRYVRRYFGKLRYCYEKALLAKPGLNGTVTATFEIDPHGDVTVSKATGVDASVSDCVADVIRTIEFPRPKSGSVTVTYPIKLAPGAHR
jgi:hypothetical protein